MAREIKILFVLFILPLLFTGCASIFSSEYQSVGFDSDPKGADVYVNGNLAGRTPLTLEMKKMKSYIVKFKNDDKVSCEYIIDSKILAGWVLLDVLIMYPTIGLPLVIDAGTGKWNYLEPEYLHCKMKN